ncbi:hypothetical protein [Amphritea balenae]|uniref:Phage abortive infection protein n=1 Tax=Amphritea balenae TaxID=452629 RepID=A0A3P1SJZ9_9GAMM|nr:hypothetical protein [Amphritea balenae]RRC97621.1 hypothetical protein EHS89_17470 [Amphritea balenae]
MSVKEQTIEELEAEIEKIDTAGHSTWWWGGLVGIVSIILAALAFFFLKEYIDVVGNVIPYIASVDGSETSAATSENLRSQFGSLGDAVGGIFNPFLTFISIIFLIVTLMQNQRAMRQSAAALKHAEVQLKISIQEQRNVKDELEESRKVQDEIGKTQELQRVENTYFKLVSYIEQFQAKLFDVQVNERRAPISVIQEVCNARLRGFDPDAEDSINGSLERVISRLERVSEVRKLVRMLELTYMNLGTNYDKDIYYRHLFSSIAIPTLELVFWMLCAEQYEDMRNELDRRGCFDELMILYVIDERFQEGTPQRLKLNTALGLYPKARETFFS